MSLQPIKGHTHASSSSSPSSSTSSLRDESKSITTPSSLRSTLSLMSISSSLSSHTHASSSSSPSPSISSSHTPSSYSPAVLINHKPFVQYEKWMHKRVISADIFFNISLFLSPEEVAFASKTCQLWNRSLDNQKVWKKQYETQGYAPPKAGVLNYNYKTVFKQPIPNAILPSHYTTYFGVKVVDPKPRPPKMRFENNQLDPEDELRQTVGQTHIWTCRPMLEINGKVTSLTIPLLEQLVQKPLQGDPTGFASKDIIDEQINASMGNSEWYLIRKTIFKDTRGASPEAQVDIVRGKGYQLPLGRDVILTALVWRVLTGKSLFSGNNPVTFTNALERPNGRLEWNIGFTRYGLAITGYNIDENGDSDAFPDDDFGLTGVRCSFP
ncbi:MAG TPA: hypothetical protein VLG76_07335 [Rhabdochlamydiaceae bacterium]|nr:hypothetical protein [Rhabdochlamydiaceae bacterium]